MTKINYIVAFYFGPRRNAGAAYNKDPLTFLRAQVDKLSTLTHSLSGITFVINGDMPPTVIPDKIGEVSVRVIRRKNTDGSYGAWDEALRVCAGSYDFHILMEDDFIPNLNGFDLIYLEKIKSSEYGVMYQLFTDHAAMSGCIIKDEALRKAISTAGTLLQISGKSSYPDLEFHQRTFHLRFREHGIQIGSLADHGIFSRFFTAGGRFIPVGIPENTEPFIPFQVLE